MKPGQLFDSFLRIMGVLFCICLLIIGVVCCWPYADALTWHLRHGNLAPIGEFQVPVDNWVRPDPDNGLGLRVNLRRGQFGDMYFELGRKVTPGNRWKEGWEAASKSADPRIAEFSKHQLTLKTTEVMIADQPSFCFDDGLTIRCIPEIEERGLTVEFFGSSELKPVFYRTLSKITRTAHK
jgi:hypothetical protein